MVCCNRPLRRFMVIEIKTHKPTRDDLGRLQTFANCYDRCEKLPDENPAVGMLLCAAKNDSLAKITLPEGNTSILAGKYQLHLPPESNLIEEIKKVVGLAEEK